MSDSKDGKPKGEPKMPEKPDAGNKFDLKQAQDRMKKLKNLMTIEMKKALRKPSSEYGGPIRISSGIPMKFPHTFTAKIVQFPWKFYYNNNWIYKYYLFAIIVCIPIFKKFSNVANSPENKVKWAALRKKEEMEHAHH